MLRLDHDEDKTGHGEIKDADEDSNEILFFLR